MCQTTWALISTFRCLHVRGRSQLGTADTAASWFPLTPTAETGGCEGCELQGRCGGPGTAVRGLRPCHLFLRQGWDAASGSASDSAVCFLLTDFPRPGTPARGPQPVRFPSRHPRGRPVWWQWSLLRAPLRAPRQQDTEFWKKGSADRLAEPAGQRQARTERRLGELRLRISELGENTRERVVLRGQAPLGSSPVFSRSAGASHQRQQGLLAGVAAPRRCTEEQRGAGHRRFVVRQEISGKTQRVRAFTMATRPSSQRGETRRERVRSARSKGGACSRPCASASPEPAL